MHFLQLVRWKNLLIVALTQYLLQYLLLVPAFSQGGVNPVLSGGHFALFVFTTVLIAAGGYIINDIEDVAIDRVNKPYQMIVERFIPVKTAQNLYYGLFVLGFVISLYLAYYVNNMPLVLIFPAAWWMLYTYSKKLKKTVIVGNVVVALFCAFVAGVILFAERDAFALLLYQNPEAGLTIWLLFVGYCGFAFLSTMLREIIKDMEDVLGDMRAGGRTLPIVLGIRGSRRVATFFNVSLLILLITFLMLLFNLQWWWSVVFIFLGIFPALVLLQIRLMKAVKPVEFARVSQLAKFIMLTGLLLLMVIGWEAFY